jgi:hypothetical protein
MHSRMQDNIGSKTQTKNNKNKKNNKLARPNQPTKTCVTKTRQLKKN